MASGLDFHALLLLTKSEYRINNPSPTGHPYDKIIVGAVIFHPTSSPPAKILLLKRAATEKFYPNVFEIPGGHVEDTDADIFHALVREVREETTLSVDSAKASIEPFAYSTEKTIRLGEEKVVIQKSSLQLNFVCEIAEDKFRVNPDEPEGIWAAQDEVEGLEMTEEMSLVVKTPFAGNQSRQHPCRSPSNSTLSVGSGILVKRLLALVVCQTDSTTEIVRQSY